MFCPRWCFPLITDYWLGFAFRRLEQSVQEWLLLFLQRRRDAPGLKSFKSGCAWKSEGPYKHIIVGSLHVSQYCVVFGLQTCDCSLKPASRRRSTTFCTRWTRTAWCSWTPRTSSSAPISARRLPWTRAALSTSLVASSSCVRFAKRSNCGARRAANSSVFSTSQFDNT